jgi:hypothetical protein
MKLVEILVRSNSRFARKEDRDNNMAIEGCRYVGRKIS